MYIVYLYELVYQHLLSIMASFQSWLILFCRHYAQAQLYSDQPFRLVFRLTGSGVTGGLDYVTFSNDTCQPFSEHFACIDMHVVCKFAWMCM